MSSQHEREREQGSVAVEAVVLIPAAMLIVMLVVQVCLWAEAASFVQAAALQGEQAATDSGGSTEDGIVQARSFLDGSARYIVVEPAVEVDPLAGDAVLVRVTGRAEAILPWIDFGVSAVRVGTRQEFRATG